MSISSVSRVLALASIAALAACSAGTSTVPSGGGGGGVVTPHYMYVTNTNSVLAFDLTATGNVAPAFTIAGGTNFANIYSLAIDATGRVAVPASGNAGVVTYAAGASGTASPVSAIFGPATTLVNVDGVAFDATGRLYVADINDDTIKIFAAGATGNVAPSAVLNTVRTAGIVFDPAGKFYAPEPSDVLVFAGTATGNTAPLQNLTYSAGVNQAAIDPTGKLVLAGCSTHAVNFYAAGATGAAAPVSSIAGAATGLGCPVGAAFDPSGNLWVVQNAGIGVGPASILKFAAGATGNVAPIATISGAATTFTGPSAIVYH